MHICFRHHNAYYVFGRPGDNEKNSTNYETRMKTYLKYKGQYESIEWFLDGSPEAKAKFADWGR